MKEIQQALGGASEAEAKVVMKSLNTAMLKIPVAIRGVGDKLMDINTALNPVAAKYSRVQGAARFVYNPFFRWQQTYQTEALAQLETGGKIIQLPFLNQVNRIMFGSQMRENAATIKLLEDRNIFGQGFSGAGATGDIQGKIGTRILKGEKVSLAGIVQKQAKVAGQTVEDYVANNESAVIDTLQMITTNNKTQNFLDSPLARTLNTAFFPFRYNMKVANLMAGYIGKFNPATQVALVAGFLNVQDWLNSDAGVAWQTQYSDAIKLFNWLSPTYPLSYVMNIVNHVAHPDEFTVGDLGLLGGLPFGMISQFLENNGTTNLSAPYLDPKTGDVYPKYIPQTTRAQVNLAVQDFLGATFSYPGSIIGLPSKGSILRDFTGSIVGGKDEFTAVDESGNLTEQQKHQQAVIKTTSGKATSAQPTSGTSPSLAAPSDVTTVTPTLPTVAPRASTASAKKKKKSAFVPTPIQ